MAVAQPPYLDTRQAAAYVAWVLRGVRKRIHATGVWRWMRKGLRARSGERVYLRHVRVGRRVLTRVDWICEFFEALADEDAKGLVEDSPGKRSVAPNRPSRRARDRCRARAELRAAGIICDSGHLSDDG